MTVAKLKRSLKTDERDGFKFAVALIIAFSTFGNTIYHYVNNNPVNSYLYVVLNVLFPISLTIFGLIVYITIKGVSLEISNRKLKEQLEESSSLIYISTFRLFFFYIIVKICDSVFNKYFMPYFDQDGLTSIKVIFTLVIFCTLFEILGIDNSKKSFPHKISVPYIVFVCIVTVLVLSGFVITPYLLTGDVKVRMGDTYCTNDTHIPIYIVNTGYNGNITITLNEARTEDNILTLDSIKLNNKGLGEVIPGKYLFANTLSYGEYKVYIETTNLTQGYYQLSFLEESQKNHWIPIVEKVFPIAHKKYNVFYFEGN